MTRHAPPGDTGGGAGTSRHGDPLRTQPTVHPAILRIHDLLYLTVQHGKELYDPDKSWDPDTISGVADIVAEHIPRPDARASRTPDMAPNTDQAPMEILSPDSRIWECPSCRRRIDHSYEDLAYVGTPICGDCEVDMEMV